MAADVNEIAYNSSVLELATIAGEDAHNCIVEYEGDYYYIGADSDWPYSGECALEYDVVDDFENNLILATRRSVGTGTQSYSQVPYIYERHLSDASYKAHQAQILNKDRRWVAKGDYELSTADTFLPDSEFGIYKELKDFNGDVDASDVDGHFVVYDADVDTYFCIRQCCPACNKDNVIIHRKKKDYRIVSTDLAAQEPRCNVMSNPGEKTWRDVFQNDTLRADPILLLYLNTLFKEQFKVNVDMDLKYQEFIDAMFFLDHSRLYQFNSFVLKLKQNPQDIEAKSELCKIIDEFGKAWQDFIS